MFMSCGILGDAADSLKPFVLIQAPVFPAELLKIIQEQTQHLVSNIFFLEISESQKTTALEKRVPKYH